MKLAQRERGPDWTREPNWIGEPNWEMERGKKIRERGKKEDGRSEEEVEKASSPKGRGEREIAEQRPRLR